MEAKYILMIAILLGIVLYFWLTMANDAEWRKNITIGITCDFYVNEDRMHGTIRHIEPEIGKVVVTDNEMRGHIVFISDIYPPSNSQFTLFV
jgi:hypothetical protein